MVESECGQCVSATQQHGPVRLSVLLIHDHVDDGVDTARHVDQHVAHHVQLWGTKGGSYYTFGQVKR